MPIAKVCVARDYLNNVGRPAKAELLSRIEGVSSQPVQHIVLQQARCQSLSLSALRRRLQYAQERLNHLASEFADILRDLPLAADMELSAELCG